MSSPVPPVDYDAVASAYDERYRVQEFGALEHVILDFAGPTPATVVEVGCGTGHWLGVLESGRHRVVGIDASSGMLQQARKPDGGRDLIQAHAKALPLESSSADRVVCVNALHHFHDQEAFVREARRILRPGGGIVTIGLDPHVGGDDWWIYDHFPSTRELDRRRYPATSTIRDVLATAGFFRISTFVAQHLSETASFDDASTRGVFDRRSTSHLMIIGDDEYDAGIAQLKDGRPNLTVDLRLYATTGWLE